MKSALLRKAERGVAVALIALLRPSKLSALLRCPLSLRIKMLEQRQQLETRGTSLRCPLSLTNKFVRIMALRSDLINCDTLKRRALKVEEHLEFVEIEAKRSGAS